MLQLQTLLPAKPVERLDALFSSQFRSLGKEQWQCLLAFTLLDSVAESSVTLADPAFQGCSLAYPLNRKGEYEVMVGQDGQAEKGEYRSVSPAALFRLLEDVVFVDEAVVEKWIVYGMADA